MQLAQILRQRKKGLCPEEFIAWRRHKMTGTETAPIASARNGVCAVRFKRILLRGCTVGILEETDAGSDGTISMGDKKSYGARPIRRGGIT
jgi:hypothetical protein